jgi:hypothetical protein
MTIMKTLQKRSAMEDLFEDVFIAHETPAVPEGRRKSVAIGLNNS